MIRKQSQKERWDHPSLEWIHHVRVQLYQEEGCRPLSEVTPRPSRGAAAIARRLNLKTIHGFTYDGILVYTKGKLHRESGHDVYYILISSKRAVEG